MPGRRKYKVLPIETEMEARYYFDRSSRKWVEANDILVKAWQDRRMVNDKEVEQIEELLQEATVEYNTGRRLGMTNAGLSKSIWRTRKYVEALVAKRRGHG